MVDKGVDKPRKQVRRYGCLAREGRTVSYSLGQRALGRILKVRVGWPEIMLRAPDPWERTISTAQPA